MSLTKAKARAKDIYSTGITYDRHLHLPKYFYSTTHRSFFLLPKFFLSLFHNFPILVTDAATCCHIKGRLKMAEKGRKRPKRPKKNEKAEKGRKGRKWPKKVEKGRKGRLSMIIMFFQPLGQSFIEIFSHHYRKRCLEVKPIL
jgi:hypothetical protein